MIASSALRFPLSALRQEPPFFLRTVKQTDGMSREVQEEPRPLYEGGGAGGKFRKSSVRKPPSSPYDRPIATSARQTDGWISRIAEPASRIATRFFPSFFSKPRIDDSSHEALDSETGQEEISEDAKCLPGSKKLGPLEKGSSSEVGLPNDCLHNNELVKQNLSSLYNGSGLLEIEQFLKQKTFSRDEFTRLTEILRARTADLSNDDRRVKENLDARPVTAADARNSFHQSEVRTPTKEKQAEPLGNMMIASTSSSLLQSPIHDIGSSPVEVAKAFMGARTAEPGPTSQSLLSKGGMTPSYDFGRELSTPAPAIKSPICWPGAMVEDIPRYITPQTQRGRTAFHNLPRTPYSRPTSKLQHGGESPINLSSFQWRQQQTPLFGGKQRSNSAFDDANATVGPIRTTRQNFVRTTTSEGANLSHSARSAILPSSASEAFQTVSSTVPEILKPFGSLKSSTSTKFSPVDSKETKSHIRSSIVHAQSSEMARKILEHLDRTIPSPKDKSTELGLVLARRKSTPGSTTETVDGQPKENGGQEKGLICSNPESSDLEASGLGNANIMIPYTGAIMAGSGCVSTGFPPKPLEGFKEAHGSQSTKEEGFLGLHNRKFGNKDQLPSLRNHDVLQIQRPQFHSSGSKPALTHISVTKSDGTRACFSDCSSFSFPIPLASGSAICEPPTPTIVPGISAAKTSCSKEDTTVPSFSFGSSTSRKPLDFSINSTVSPAILDASGPKFSFGSDSNKGRASFRLVGKDAVCY